MKNLIRYGILFLFWFFDIVVAGIFEEIVTQAVVIFYLYQVMKKPSLPFICFSFLLISLQSFLFYGRFGIQLIYIIPATIVGFYFKKTLTAHSTIRYLLLTSCLLVQWLIINPFLIGNYGPWLYTIGKIGVNILIMMVIC